MTFNRKEIESHIALLHRLAHGIDGVLILAAFEEGGRSQVQRFAVGKIDDMVTAVMSLEGRRGVNLYAPWCILRRDLDPGKKGGEADVVAVMAAVGDIDNDKQTFPELPFEAPYVVESSPGNFQKICVFSRPISPSAAKPVLAALSAFLGGDAATKDVSHVWRIPGTLNWPTRSKIARGRATEPVLATIKKGYDGGFVQLETLLALAPRRKQSGNGAASSQDALLDEREATRLRSALKVISADERDVWIEVGMALHTRAAREIWDEWSATSSKFDPVDQEGAWHSFHADRENAVTIGSVFKRAREAGWTEPGVSLDDFYAYKPMHTYIFTPSRDTWPAVSVNRTIMPVLTNGAKPMAADVWLDRHRSIEQMTWAPGEPMVIRDRLISDGGWIEHEGVSCFNLYRPPILLLGDARLATRWTDHVRRVYLDQAEHIIKWCAHRAQRPQEKINHALLLGGNQGIGKDTMLEPVKHAVGSWNFQEVSPQQLLGRFNGFLRSVILRVSEARDLGDMDRFQFYDHMKNYTAAPPDVLRVDEKYLREYVIPNCCGVIITSNHKADGVYLPIDDRRHFVAWSDITKEEFTPAYWNGLWRWYEKEGGYGHVAAYLLSLDLAFFDSKAPPCKTPAFWDIVDAGRAPEEDDLADVLDQLHNPDATTNGQIITAANGREIQFWFTDRKNRRTIPHRLERCGYVPVRNLDRADGRWIIGGERQVVYARKTLSLRDRFIAANSLALRGRTTEEGESSF